MNTARMSLNGFELNQWSKLWFWSVLVGIIGLCWGQAWITSREVSVQAQVPSYTGPHRPNLAETSHYDSHGSIWSAHVHATLLQLPYVSHVKSHSLLPLNNNFPTIQHLSGTKTSLVLHKYALHRSMGAAPRPSFSWTTRLSIPGKLGHSMNSFSPNLVIGIRKTQRLLST